MTGDPDVIRMAHRDAQSSPSTLSVRLAMQLRLLHDALQQRSNLLHALGNPDRVCNATQAAVERDMAPFCSALSGCPRGIPGCNSGSQSAECSGGTCRIFALPRRCSSLFEAWARSTAMPGSGVPAGSRPSSPLVPYPKVRREQPASRARVTCVT